MRAVTERVSRAVRTMRHAWLAESSVLTQLRSFRWGWRAAGADRRSSADAAAAQMAERVRRMHR